MKKIIKLFSFLIVFAILLSSIHCLALVEESDVVVAVDKVYGSPEGTVNVDVTIENNPGILGATFCFTYDNDLLTLTNAVAGEAFSALIMSKPGKLTSPCRFSWDGEALKSEDVKDGIVLTLTFQISENAIPGTDLDVEISYSGGDIVDGDLNPVNPQTVSGTIQVIDYTPGDVDGDKVINARDLILIRRYINGGYDITINEYAADVNDDGKINTTDIILIRRYIAGGYGVKLKPSHGLHEHTMEEIKYKAPTCEKEGNEAYWYCSECGSYFSDIDGLYEITSEDVVIEATGHTEEEIPAVAPDYDKEGSHSGVKCSVCNEILVKPEVIPPLKPDEVSISYKYDTIAGDSYLSTAVARALAKNQLITQETKNVTEKDYTELPFIDNEIILGYEFQGWYTSTATDAQKVTCIAKGEKGNITLYARWIKTEFTVTLKAPLKSVPTITRTIDQTTLLPADKDMVVPNYYFMGWSDGSGTIIDQIDPGIGNITVYANWTSATRNIAYASDYKNQEPIIMEDNGQYLFVYNIGYIDRVPIAIIEDSIYNSGTYKYIVESFESATISEGNEKEINTTVANATTHSSSWTLSQEWNELITEVNGTEQSMEQGKVVAVSDGSSKAYSSSGSTYSGNSFHASNDSFVSSKTITDDSYKNSASLEAGLSYGPAKVTATVSGEQAHSEHQEDYAESKASMGVAAEWNQSNSYSASGQSFVSTTQTQSILEQAKNTWNLEISKATTDREARTDEESTTTSSTEGYKSIVAFHNEATKGNSTTIERTFTDVGYYRYAMFAKVHVFAVVGYDMKTGCYFVNTYSVLDDATVYDFDYSSDGSYKDYENAVLPFEVPISVYDYIFENNAKTEGLSIGRDGVVKEYTGDATNVRIPDYATFDNGDGTYTVVPVTAIADGLFENKTNIQTVRLSKYITSIPTNAFKGCSSLEKVEYNYDALETIGDYAFEGCVSLQPFEVGNATKCKVKTIGKDAFKNVPKVIVYANSKDMVEATVSGGAKSISVYMKHLSNSEVAKLSGVILETAPTTTTSFAIYGADKSYINLCIKSYANTTIINGMTFKESAKTPLVIYSKEVELYRVNIENALGIAIQFTSDSTNLTIKSVNNISTQGNIAILSKKLVMNRGTGEYPEFNIAGGDVVVLGETENLKNFAYLKITDGVIRSVISTEYENLLKTHHIRFNANGGNVSIDSKEVRYEDVYGELPTPTRDYYTFDGWFTAADGGEQVTTDTIMTANTDVVVYAHWKLNEISGWVKASEMPLEAQVIKEKWSYVLREYTTNSAASLSGWIQYDVQRTSWGATQGPVYYDPSNGVRNVWSEQYVASQTTHYTYYHRYGWGYNVSTGQNGYVWSSDSQNPSAERHTIDLTYALTKTSNFAGNECWKGYKCPHCGATNIWLGQSTYTTDNYATRWYYQEPVYTYYFYRDLSKEDTFDPTGKSDVSNVVKWVQYRAK